MTFPPVAAAAAVCDSCGAELATGAPLCTACGEPTAPPERRLVSLLFVDLTGYTALGSQLDPEEVYFVLRPVMTGLRRMVEAFGGVVPQVQGDGFMATFGVPVAHEDDAVRAVRAGLAALDHVRTIGPAHRGVPIPPVHAGVETGEVLVAASRELSGFSVTGSAVNLAARLCSLAEPGHLLVGPGAYALTADAVEYADARAQQVKGLAAPVLVREPRAARREPGGRPAGSDPLVGRGPELRQLRDLLNDSVNAPHSRVVALLGEAGIGKSRLVDAAVASTTELTALHGRCAAYPRGSVFGGLVQALTSHLNLRPNASLPEVVEAVRRLAATWTEPDGAAERLLTELLSTTGTAPSAVAGDSMAAARALRRTVECLAADRPVVVVLDDWMYADDDLQALVDGVARRPTKPPVLWLLLGRSDTVVPAAADRIELRPLSPDDMAELLDARLGAPAEPELRRQLLARVGGNPLLLNECTRLLKDSGALRSDGDQVVAADHEAVHAVPSTLRGFLSARLDRLTGPEREVLRAAAVSGPSTWLDLLDRLLPTVEVGQLVKALTDKGMLRLRLPSRVPATEEYEFTQQLLSEVAAAETPHRARASRHLVTAQWLRDVEVEHAEWSAPLAELAHHYEHAWRLGRSDATGVTGSPEAARLAVAYLVRLGRQLLRLQPRAAEEVLSRAAHVTTASGRVPPSVRAELHLLRGRALTDLQRRADALAEVEQAMPLALHGESPGLLAEVQLLRGSLAYHDRIEEGRALLEEARERFSVLRNVGGEARAVHNLAYTWRYADVRRMVALFEQAQELFARAGDTAGRSQVVSELAYWLTLRGGPDFDRWYAVSESLVGAENDLRGRAGLARTRAFAALYQGRPHVAVRAATEARSLADAGGLRWLQIDAMLVELVAAGSLGELPSAERLNGQLRAAAAELTWPRLLAMAQASGALTALLGGDVTLARARLEQADALLVDLGAVLDRTEVGRAHAELCLHRGLTPADTSSLVKESLGVLDSAGGELFGLPLSAAPARLRLLWGTPDPAELAELAATAADLGADGYRIVLARSAAQARLLAGGSTGPEDADASAAAAQSASGEPETPEQRALAAELQALGSLRAGDVGSASRHLAVARTAWAGMGATAWRARALAWSAACSRRLGDFPAAERQLLSAAELLDRLESPLDVPTLMAPLERTGGLG